MRQRKLKWSEDFLATSPLMIREYPVNLSKPLELEIGCGKGDFLKEKARLNPNTHFIGIDVQGSCLAIAMKKASEAELGNINFALLKAELLSEKFPKETFKAIYLNFSDPWPKARHEKRRLTSPKYLDMYYELLEKGGTITFKSDNVGLFAYSKETFRNSKFKVVSMEDAYQPSENEPLSEYEKKFRSLGQDIGRIIVIKEA